MPTTIPPELQNHQTIQIQIVEPETSSLLDRLQASGFVTTEIARSTLPIPATPTSQTISIAIIQSVTDSKVIP